MKEDIHTSLKSGVLTISLTRIEKKNSITNGIYRNLTSILSDAKSDSAIRVAVIRGTEQVFCAGNDLEEFASSSPDEDGSAALDFLKALYVFPKPLIAGVCGAAVGIGATMLLHCDLVFAGDNARFSMPFVNLGLCPEAASSMLLPELVGFRHATELLLTGAPFNAEKALSIGFVNKVLPASSVFLHVDMLAQDLAQKPARALVETKRLMKAGDGPDVMRRMTDESEVFRRLLTEEAAQEAIAAFREKRPPDVRKFVAGP